MNDAPPPLSPSPYRQPAYQEPARGSGGGGRGCLGCSLGCFFMVIVGAVGAYLLFVGAKKMVEQYTATQAVPVEAPVASQDQIDGAISKFDAFRTGMESGGTPVPLSLTGDEINMLIFNHPDFAPVAGKAAVAIDGDELRSRVSIDLNELNLPEGAVSKYLDGKYFNGEVALSLNMVDGRPEMYLKGLSVNGLAVPDALLSGIKDKNVFEKILEDPDAKAEFDRIEDMKIENGRFIIVPKTGDRQSPVE